jgi:uncharacterized protein with LGFP repeats
MGSIASKYHELGGKAVLGDPVGPLHVVDGPAKVDPKTKQKSPGDKIGECQAYQHGVIAALGDGDAFGVYGPIFPLADWTTNSAVGWPIADSHEVIDGGKSLGWYSQFQHQVLYLANGQKAVVPMSYDAIRLKYNQLGGPVGLLKFPLAASQGTSEGAFVDFQNGSIFECHAGVHEVHGLIRELWRNLGAQNNPAFGFPISDELTIPGTADRYNDFENGVILWKRGEKAAAEVKPLSISVSGQTLPVPAQAVLDKVSALLQQEISQIQLPSQVKAINVTAGPFFRVGLLDDPDVVSANPTTIYSPGAIGINRRHKTRTMLELVTDWPAPNFKIRLDLDILVYFERSNSKHGAIMASIFQWWYNVEAPFPAGQSDVDLAACKLEAAFKPLVGVPRPVFSVPDSFAAVSILAVKTMQDGSINVFIGN